MRFALLGSGSKGNSLFVESGGTSILIDGGFSGKGVAERMALIDRDPEDLRAIFISHEHRDHIGGVGVLSRRLALPVYGNSATFAASDRIVKKLHRYMEFASGDVCQVQGLEVRSFSISHDSADPVAYIIGDGCHTLGCCTDTGRVSRLISSRLAGCDGLILEFNHDPLMLRNGPYPLPLQQRVRSSHGHLANEEAAALLGSVMHDGLRHIVMAHLSETNNHPRLAMACAAAAIDPCYHDRLHAAAQDRPTVLFELK